MMRRIVKIVVVAMAFSVFKNTDAQVVLFKNISTQIVVRSVRMN
jgi:hypothetical protein